MQEGMHWQVGSQEERWEAHRQAGRDIGVRQEGKQTSTKESRMKGRGRKAGEQVGKQEDRKQGKKHKYNSNLVSK